MIMIQNGLKKTIFSRTTTYAKDDDQSIQKSYQFPGYVTTFQMQTSSDTGAVRKQRRSLSLTAGELLAMV